MEFTDHTNWGTFKKILFRFACLYILLYTLPVPYSYIPGVTYLGQYINSFWNSLGVWFGESVLSIEGNISTGASGSGDRTINYLRLIVLWSVSCAGTIIWTILDRKRENYNSLIYWIRLHARYYLFAMLFSYGVAKVIKTQFPFPGLVRLIQPLGDISPMGLAWTFMGYSNTYTVFAGLMEVLAAFLLLFRKTTTLGALLTVGVMSNVVLMNFSYDIPVKLFSLHLVGFGLFILSFDMKRLLNLFVFNKPAASATFKQIVSVKKTKHALIAVKVLFIGYIMFTTVSMTLNRFQQVRPDREKPPLYGLYEVEAFELNGNEIPPLITERNRWRYLILDSPGRVAVKRMNDAIDWYEVEVDTTRRQLMFSSSSNSSSFIYNEKKLSLTLNGLFKGDSLKVTLRNKDLNEFRLINRGFNWINEYPYNR